MVPSHLVENLKCETRMMGGRKSVCAFAEFRVAMLQ